jgi:AcrR family transcriptional regulator
MDIDYPPRVIYSLNMASIQNLAPTPTSATTPTATGPASVSGPTPTRKYELRARAERQRATRDRIVAATVALHRQIGPARTTIADIARHAGVQRLTVYNTFPDLRDLFAACLGRFLAEYPLPNLAPRSGTKPLRDLERALVRIYRWYRATEAVERHIHRDRHLAPALDELMRKTSDAGIAAFAQAHALAVAGGQRSRPLQAAIRLAFEARTWELLTGEGLTDLEAAQLMKLMVRAARG